MQSSFQTRLPDAAAKRDDDFRPAKARRLSNVPVEPPWRWRRRRLLGLLVALILTYFFVKNIPDDLGSASSRTNPRFRPLSNANFPWKPPILREEILRQGGPPLPSKDSPWDEKRRQYYDGPIKFLNLSTTLRQASVKTFGGSPQNGNVLYAVSSLKSAANLIPMACDMTTWDKNHVHLAFMGRDPMELEEILSINGVDSGCPVFFHDARPDWSMWSSDERAELAVINAWAVLEDHLHPRAVITDDAELEDAFFVGPLKESVRSLGKTLIEIPAGRYEEFLWMTRLDSHALANWHSPKIDIMIHAPPRTSGGLLRLLKTLRDASYAGLRIPRLTIELPPDPDPQVYKFVSEMPWPPVWGREPREASTLSIRHRIVNSRVSPEQAAVRFLESFYPSDPHSHVLILSSEAELSPSYLQYLHYTILHHRYSGDASWSSQDVIGMSLEVPSQNLDESSAFKQPHVSDMSDEHFAKPTGKSELSRPAAFLHQAPSAKAALIFSDKWASVHDFLTNRFTIWEGRKSPESRKVIPKSQPAWLEYVLEISRCRGWFFLHPAWAFATINHELKEIPEEFSDDQKPPTGRKPRDPDPVPDNRHLHNVLPFRGVFPPLIALPYYTYDGKHEPQTAIPKHRDEYIPIFRQKFGGCSAADATKRRKRGSPIETSDLFCLPGREIVVDEEPEDVPSLVPPLSRNPNAQEAPEEGTRNLRNALADLLAEAESETVVEETDWGQG